MDHNHSGQSQKEPVVEAAAPCQLIEPGSPERGLVRNGSGLCDHSGGLERIRDDIVNHPVGNPVHHDAGYHLVDIEPGFQEALKSAPQHTCQQSGQYDRRQQNDSGRRQGQCRYNGSQSGNHHLPCSANVEQAGFISKGNRQAGEDERNGVGKGVEYPCGRGYSSAKEVQITLHGINAAGQQ